MNYDSHTFLYYAQSDDDYNQITIFQLTRLLPLLTIGHLFKGRGCVLCCNMLMYFFHARLYPMMILTNHHLSTDTVYSVVDNWSIFRILRICQHMNIAVEILVCSDDALYELILPICIQCEEKTQMSTLCISLCTHLLCCLCGSKSIFDQS